jgi:hypothetical protein
MKKSVSSEILESIRRIFEALRLNLSRWSLEIVDKTSISATPYKNSPF